MPFAQLSRKSRPAECHYPTVVRHQRMRVLHFGHGRPQIRPREDWTAGPCLPRAVVWNRACCSPHTVHSCSSRERIFAIMQARAWPVPCVREHLRVRRKVLATRQTHTVATVTGCPSGTTSSSGNILPNIAACPLVYLSGPITQPWHERQRACVGARACSSPHASVRALIHSHRLFHARILPPHRCASVARGRIHARYFTYAHATRHREAYSSISRHLLWRCSHD